MERQSSADSKQSNGAEPTKSGSGGESPKARRGRSISTTEASTFWGAEGATSLKAEIVARIPQICDSSHFREARQLLLELGGASVLLSELAFAGFVDTETNLLTANEKPFNIFARLAAGVMTQPWMDKEQLALGEHKEKFMMCANKPESDLHWDSTDPKWVGQASMSQRHRFLTTKNLHWQWFNLLTVGLVEASDGGLSIREALAEIEEMKAAALLFAKNVGGWSDNIGLYVSIFGHNNVNSFFMHVLDMSCLGPGWNYHAFKNCSIDCVLKVLREEAASNVVVEPVHQPHPPAVCQRSVGVRRRSVQAGPGMKAGVRAPFFFSGYDGATSLKEELVGRVPVLNDAAGFREARRLLKEEFGGHKTLREELFRAGFLDGSTSLLSTHTKPFNVFARCAAGLTKQPAIAHEQQFLGEFQQMFHICCNLPECDAHWDSQEAEWIGKASMSIRHRFLTMKDLHWQWFNALTFGIVDPTDGGASPMDALQKVALMKQAALTYVSGVGGWSEQIGLFFHIFGHNSVNSLHLHIVDLAEVGPTYFKFEYKNCDVDCVIKVLHEEVRACPISQVREATDSATAAAVSATRVAEQMALMMTDYPTLIKPVAGAGHAAVQRKVHTKKESLLNLNVSGEIITVHRDTLRVAPAGSHLQRMFGDDFASTVQELDEEGRIFLNFPPRSFRLIVGHLQLLHMTPSTAQLEPPFISQDTCKEFQDLAWLLGVEEFLLTTQYGQAPGEPRKLTPRMPPMSKV